MPDTAIEDLCGCLRRIAALLERGQPEEAATLVPEMLGMLPQVPLQLPQGKVDEAKDLLARCVGLEQSLRQGVLVSLRRLAATRRSSIYRRYGSRP